MNNPSSSEDTRLTPPWCTLRSAGGNVHISTDSVPTWNGDATTSCVSWSFTSALPSNPLLAYGIISTSLVESGLCDLHDVRLFSQQGRERAWVVLSNAPRGGPLLFTLDRDVGLLRVDGVVVFAGVPSTAPVLLYVQSSQCPVVRCFHNPPRPQSPASMLMRSLACANRELIHRLEYIQQQITKEHIRMTDVENRLAEEDASKFEELQQRHLLSLRKEKEMLQTQLKMMSKEGLMEVKAKLHSKDKELQELRVVNRTLRAAQRMNTGKVQSMGTDDKGKEMSATETWHQQEEVKLLEVAFNKLEKEVERFRRSIEVSQNSIQRLTPTLTPEREKLVKDYERLESLFNQRYTECLLLKKQLTLLQKTGQREIATLQLEEKQTRQHIEFYEKEMDFMHKDIAKKTALVALRREEQMKAAAAAAVISPKTERKRSSSTTEGTPPRLAPIRSESCQQQPLTHHHHVPSSEKDIASPPTVNVVKSAGSKPSNKRVSQPPPVSSAAWKQQQDKKALERLERHNSLLPLLQQGTESPDRSTPRASKEEVFLTAQTSSQEEANPPPVASPPPSIPNSTNTQPQERTVVPSHSVAIMTDDFELYLASRYGTLPSQESLLIGEGPKKIILSQNEYSSLVNVSSSNSHSSIVAQDLPPPQPVDESHDTSLSPPHPETDHSTNEIGDDDLRPLLASPVIRTAQEEIQKQQEQEVSIATTSTTIERDATPPANKNQSLHRYESSSKDEAVTLPLAPSDTAVNTTDSGRKVIDKDASEDAPIVTTKEEEMPLDPLPAPSNHLAAVVTPTTPSDVDIPEQPKEGMSSQHGGVGGIRKKRTADEGNMERTPLRKSSLQTITASQSRRQSKEGGGKPAPTKERTNSITEKQNAAVTTTSSSPTVVRRRSSSKVASIRNVTKQNQAEETVTEKQQPKTTLLRKKKNSLTTQPHEPQVDDSVTNPQPQDNMTPGTDEALSTVTPTIETKQNSTTQEDYALLDVREHHVETSQQRTILMARRATTTTGTQGKFKDHDTEEAPMVPINASSMNNSYGGGKPFSSSPSSMNVVLRCSVASMYETVKPWNVTATCHSVIARHYSTGETRLLKIYPKHCTSLQQATREYEIHKKCFTASPQHVVQVFEIIDDDVMDAYVIAMEHVPLDLLTWVQTTHSIVTESTVISLTHQLLKAMCTFHSLDVYIHNGLRPDGIVVKQEGAGLEGAVALVALNDFSNALDCGNEDTATHPNNSNYAFLDVHNLLRLIYFFLTAEVSPKDVMLDTHINSSRISSTLAKQFFAQCTAESCVVVSHEDEFGGLSHQPHHHSQVTRWLCHPWLEEVGCIAQCEAHRVREDWTKEAICGAFVM